MSLQYLNPNSEYARKSNAISINISAARGLLEVMKTNLGPKGTMKMLVGGSGDIRVTKDGNVLLHQMQIQHPTAAMIARTATAQDDILGDGTTTTVLLVGEMLKQSEKYLASKLHPTLLVDGFEMAKEESLKFLDSFKSNPEKLDRELLVGLAKTSLRTKIRPHIADDMAEIVVDAVDTIRRDNQEIDLHMVEVMHMEHRMDSETRLVRGLVLDHGARHPNMKKHVEDAYILTCNISLEFEKTEVNSGFYYSSAQERQKLVDAERRVTDSRVQKVIDLKNQVCKDNNKEFVFITQQGIDPISLDLLQQEGIVGIRRAKRRNMERLTLACGGTAINSVEDLSPEVLGHADRVYEYVLGEEKYTFVEGVQNPFSCTILLKGPNKHTIAQLKDAVRDGLRAVKNTIDDGCVVPGAGSFELACHDHLQEFEKKVSGKAKLGVRAFAESLLAVPKTLAENSGFDAMDVLISLQEQLESGVKVGLDIDTGEALDVETAGIWDNYRVKRQSISASTFTATQLLYVDEIMRAGKGGGNKLAQ
eukprot:gb/GECH01008906.1/.p1 GENE.gb/GECH01008906.1/~~gb/GECH01008906.1/.p1  ORF type:complete len:534 (+),score=126.78 gb/GECH01008906.1/:1-1602(+)